MPHQCRNCGVAYPTRYDWAHHGCETPGPIREWNRVYATMPLTVQAIGVAAGAAPLVRAVAQIAEGMTLIGRALARICSDS